MFQKFHNFLGGLTVTHWETMPMWLTVFCLRVQLLLAKLNLAS